MPREHNFGDIGDDDGMVQRVVEQHEQHERVTVVFLDGGAQGWGDARERMLMVVILFL